MPGTPPVTPNYLMPRVAGSDGPPDGPATMNGGMDLADANIKAGIDTLRNLVSAPPKFLGSASFKFGVSGTGIGPTASTYIKPFVTAASTALTTNAEANGIYWDSTLEAITGRTTYLWLRLCVLSSAFQSINIGPAMFTNVGAVVSGSDSNRLLSVSAFSRNFVDNYFVAPATGQYFIGLDFDFAMGTANSQLVASVSLYKSYA